MGDKWVQVDASAVDESLFAAVDVVGGRLFRSGAGEFAMVVSVRGVIDSAAVDVVVSDVAAGVDHLVFVAPPRAAAARDFLASKEIPAAAARIAMPDGADVSGLVLDRGRIAVRADGASMTYRLYRPQALQIPRGPRMGEGPDVLDDRSAWFNARHRD